MMEEYSLPEPILKENPDRFVIFPFSTKSYGKSIKNNKHAFGLLRKLIFQQI
jgi:hypothetical protein